MDKFVLYAAEVKQGSSISRDLLATKLLIQGTVGAKNVFIRRVRTATLEDARARMRQECAWDHQHTVSWLLPMDLEEYLTVRGPENSTPNSLKPVLRDWPFRMGPGALSSAAL